MERKLNESERVRLEESLQLAREQQQRNMMQMAQTSTNAMAIAQPLRETKQDPTCSASVSQTPILLASRLDKAIGSSR